MLNVKDCWCKFGMQNQNILDTWGLCESELTTTRAHSQPVVLLNSVECGTTFSKQTGTISAASDKPTLKACFHNRHYNANSNRGFNKSIFYLHSGLRWHKVVRLDNTHLVFSVTRCWNTYKVTQHYSQRGHIITMFLILDERERTEEQCIDGFYPFVIRSLPIPSFNIVTFS